MIGRDKERVETILRFDERRHAREQLELFIRHLEFCVALRFIFEEGHSLVNQNREWVLRVGIKLALRQV